MLIAALQAPAIRKFTGLSGQRVLQNTALAVPLADLIVSEARFFGPPERRGIAGALQNRSRRTYTDIQVTFSLVGPDGDTIGLATVTLDRIGGHETANFETVGVEPKAVEIVLRHIETHPPLAGAP